MTTATLAGTDTLIERRPDRWGGRPLIAGTRVSVQKIGDLLLIDGMSADEIVEDFGGILTRAQVHAAIAYYLVNKEWFDADLLVQAEEFEQARQEYYREIGEQPRRP